ncbi:MAG TPA: allantoinase AllB [Opitutaceae bacterium]
MTKTETSSDELQLIVRGGNVVTPEGVKRADLGIAGGRFVKIAPQIDEPAAETLDAEGRYVFPGIIDAHVHFNEPGRTEWEGLASGSAALAAGGGTLFFDMPLNSEPPVLDAAALREKRRLAEEKSYVDFALWGGLTPINLDKLAGLRDAGAIGLKAFMSASGIESFPRVDEKTLREGMKRAKQLGLLVAVHAEDDALAAKFTVEQKVKGRTDAKAWLASRPIEVELAAIRLATELAGETGCALHIVHVSSPEGVSLVEDARDHRVDVTAETCPHYLLLNDKQVAKIGAAAKCAPPIRDEANRKGLWVEVNAGRIHTLGSDHSPAPADMKTSPNFFEIWGGIGGVQHGFQLLLSEYADAAPKEREAGIARMSALLARNVARRFRIDGHKGAIAEGRDADFCVFEFGEPHTIEADELWTQHRISAYIGRKNRVRMLDTCVRGNFVYRDGRFTNFAPPGSFVRPGR